EAGGAAAGVVGVREGHSHAFVVQASRLLSSEGMQAGRLHHNGIGIMASPEPLDIEQPDALAAYLRDTGRIGPDEPVRIRTLAGGVSNKTVLVERPSGEAWVLKQALSKLRVAVDWFSDPARIHREALGLKYLAELAPPGTITPLVFEDAGHHLLAMEAVPQPHENWKT